LLLGVHYDSVGGSPGANDNASGVAALLEISRMFWAFEPALTVRFVAFVNEEPPFFGTSQQGSIVYAQAARRRGDDIRLMASLETIGCYSSEPGSQGYPPLFRFFYPDCGNFIGIVSDFRSRAAMRRLAAAFCAHSDFPLQTVSTFRFVPGVAWSDHDSFWRHGYGAQTPSRSRAEMEALASVRSIRSAKLPLGKLSVHEEFPDLVAEAIKPFLSDRS
jgi:Zn-dependent M28 family amino/carboxypeptidase